jgi:hypothetical protein
MGGAWERQETHNKILVREYKRMRTLGRRSIILKGICKKLGVKVWTGIIWLMTGTIGGL